MTKTIHSAKRLIYAAYLHQIISISTFPSLTNDQLKVFQIHKDFHEINLDELRNFLKSLKK